MKSIRPLLLAAVLLAIATPSAFAKTNQVRGIDPEQEIEIPLSRAWHPFEPEKRLVAPDSGPYDPLKNLKSPLEVTRAEAASYIGWARRYECAGALVSFLSRRSGGGGDVVSALWALGQVGTADAVPVLLQWARKGGIECRIEALKSLAELRSSEALPAFIEGYARTPAPGGDPAAFETEHRLCFESLVAAGDASCLPALKRLAEKSRGREAWNEIRDPRSDLARGASDRELTALLAACGDPSARATILSSVISGSRVTEPDALLKDAAQGGNLDGFPWGFWIGKALLMDNPPRPTQWPALCAALDLLNGRPSVLDGILRDAANDHRVPDGGKALLLGCLRLATDKDLAVLESVWNAALGRRGVIAVLAIPAGGDHFERVPCNLNASAAVYAVSRLKALDLLHRIWMSTPENSLTLRGDVAVALARTGARRFAPMVAEYVSREWDRAARSSGFERRMAEGDVQVADLLHEEYSAFDFAYRNHEITRFLIACGDRNTLEGLTLDEAVHPYVRLYWIQRLAGSQREPWMMDLATKALAQIDSGETAKAPLLAALRTSTRQTVQGFRNRPVPENHPLQ